VKNIVIKYAFLQKYANSLFQLEWVHLPYNYLSSKLEIVREQGRSCYSKRDTVPTTLQYRTNLDILQYDEE
jgi:hypothetical protein